MSESRGERPDLANPLRPTADELASPPAPFDPLRLCIFATVALITWVIGPIALAGFAALGLAGYVRARRAGLMSSKCLLGDTRLVIAYLAVLFVVGLTAAIWPFVQR